MNNFTKYYIYVFANVLNLIFLLPTYLIIRKAKKPSGIAIIRLEQTLGDAVLGAVITRSYVANINEDIDVYVPENNAWIYESVPNVNVISLKNIKPRRWISESLFFVLLLICNSNLLKKNYKIIISPRYWDDRLGALLAFALKAKEKHGFCIGVTHARRHYNSFLGVAYNFSYNITSSVEHTLEVEGIVYSNALRTRPICKNELDNSDGLFRLNKDFHVEQHAIAVSLSSGNSILKKASISSFYNIIKLISERFDINKITFYNFDCSGEDERLLVKLLSMPSINYEYIFGAKSPEFLVRSLSTHKFFVGCDSGLTHLAAQCGVKTFALFTSSNYRLFAPIGDVQVIHSSVDCNPVNSESFIDRCERCVQGNHACADISQKEFLEFMG